VRFPVEGLANWIPDITDRLSDPDRRAVVLQLLEKSAREPALLLAVARK
jgi:hypothetical protein